MDVVSWLFIDSHTICFRPWWSSVLKQGLFSWIVVTRGGLGVGGYNMAGLESSQDAVVC